MPKRKGTKKRTTAQLRAMFAKAGSRFKGSGHIEKDIYGDSIRVNTRNRQTGKSNIRTDRKIRALHPGKRISASGNVYYEYRKNRSDRSRTKRL